MITFTCIFKTQQMKQVLLLFTLLIAKLLTAQTFYLGADLSYVNEMEDCGAVFYEDQLPKDPFAIFSEHEANIVRFRLWHTPEWTEYSTLEDVKKSIGRAKSEGLTVLLDFHYSDTWTDPGHQLIPAAWNEITDLEVLGDSLYNYTYNTLDHLQQLGLLPDMVQIGNETNGNILVKAGEPLYPLDWERNIFLFQRGIAAVHAINQTYEVDVKTMIHIAKPESAVTWFNQATIHGFISYDIIGISYYPGWSVHDIRGAAAIVGQMKAAHQKEVMVVETGYPWTLAWADNASNVLGSSNFLKTFGNSTSDQIQRDVLTEFSWLVKENGGLGVIYWEPAWVSTNCSTLWGVGSHWENAAFFDFNNNLHNGIGFLDYDYSIMPAALDSVLVTFKVDMTGVDTTNGVFVTGDFTGVNWQFRQMHHIGQNVFEFSQKIPGRSAGAYIFQNKDDWNTQSREPVPAACALKWNTHREFVVKKEVAEFAFKWGTCEAISGLSVDEKLMNQVQIFPNPAISSFHLQSAENINRIEISDFFGRVLRSITVHNQMEIDVDLSDIPAGIYLVTVFTDNSGTTTHKLLIK